MQIFWPRRNRMMAHGLHPRFLNKPWISTTKIAPPPVTPLTSRYYSETSQKFSRLWRKRLKGRPHLQSQANIIIDSLKETPQSTPLLPRQRQESQTGVETKNGWQSFNVPPTSLANSTVPITIIP